MLKEDSNLVEKELYMNGKPLIKGYSFYAGIFSILPNSQNIMPWVYNNFIQLRYMPEQGHMLQFDRYRSLLETCPFFSHYVIYNDMFSGGKSLIKLIKDKIDCESYCFLFVDRFYIPFYKFWHNKLHYNHEMIIYGYSDKNNQFLCADNGGEGAYTHFTCSFNELINGYFKNEESDDAYFSNIHFIQDVVIPKEPYMLNRKMLKSSLRNYINSVPMINENEWFLTGRFGFQIHKEVLEHQNTNIQNDENFIFDFRQIYLLKEHKTLMKMRLKYMKDNKILIEEDFESKYHYLASKYKSLLLISLKYCFFSKDKKLLEKYFKLFNEIILYECEVLKSLVKYLI